MFLDTVVKRLTAFFLAFPYLCMTTHVENSHPSVCTTWDPKDGSPQNTCGSQNSTERSGEIPSCPKTPPHLHGPLQLYDVSPVSSLKLTDYSLHLASGGVYSPPDCRAREKVAVIIPCRGREHHLKILLAHLHPILQRQQLEYTIFVTELAMPSTYNKGISINLAFLTAMNLDNFTCIIIHDVDLLMLNDRNLYRCSQRPRSLVVNSTNNVDSLHFNYFGGVIAVRPELFQKVNGFSNMYFGWGCEDTDFRERFFALNITYEIPPEPIGRYHALPHPRDKYNVEGVNRLYHGGYFHVVEGNEPPYLRFYLRRSSAARMYEDGLNSMLYRRLALEFRRQYTWIYFRVHEEEILQDKEIYLYPTETKGFDNKSLPITTEIV